MPIHFTTPARSLAFALGLAATALTARAALPPITAVVGDATKITAPGTWRAVPQEDGSIALVPPQDEGIVRAIITAEQHSPSIDDFLTANLPSLESGLRWTRDGNPAITHDPTGDTAVVRLKGKGPGGKDGLAIWRIKHASGTIMTALLLGETKPVENFDAAVTAIVTSAVLFPTPPSDWTRFEHKNGTSFAHPPKWKVEEAPDSLLLVPDDAKPDETYQFTGGTSGDEPSANTPATLNTLDKSLAQIYPGAKREGDPDQFPVGPQTGVMLRYTLPDRKGLTAHVYAVIISDAAIALIASGQPDVLSAREATIRQVFATLRYAKPAPKPADAPAPPAK